MRECTRISNDIIEIFSKIEENLVKVTNYKQHDKIDFCDAPRIAMTILHNHFQISARRAHDNVPPADRLPE